LDNIINLLKALHYPYFISKNTFVASTAPHNWPQLLSVLNFLVFTNEQNQREVLEPED
jgi:SMC interacting uncharacterized protein involved in chromosome segregation